MQDRTKEVNKILDEVRPNIQIHSGDVELKSVKDNIVTLKIKGACVGCPMAQMTFNQGIGELIKDKIPSIKEVRYE